MVTLAELAEPAHTVTWCPGCVLPGSLIQKNPSVGKIEDVKTGDMVLGSDGRYHKVTEVFAHHHTGKMYRIKSKCLGEVTLTDEHPVLSVERKQAKMHNKEFELKWVRADQLKKGDYVAYPMLKEEQDLNEVELPDLKMEMDRKSKPFPKKIRLSEEFLLLCGYYLAEGHVHKREITFTFNSKETQFVEDVQKAAESVFSLSTSARTRESKHITEVSISSSQLARHFEEWFGTGAAKKKIPRFLMLLPREKQKWLMRGMWRGDSWVGHGRANYRTVSRILAEQMKVLLVRSQIVPTVSINKASGMHKESYSIQIVSRRDLEALSDILDVKIEMHGAGKPPSSILLADFVLTPIRQIEIFEYDGVVHNMEVEEVHSYVGENAILHNCGDFGILVALKQALVKAGRAPHEIVVASGIGCGSKLPHFIKTYGFEGLHGRVLPAASAIKMANHSLTVVAVGGDGDGYGIGMGHFIHTCRRNIDFTYITHDNQIYGLTTGQTSPTSEKGFKTKSTPEGVLEEPVNPIALAISAGATFVARGFSGNLPHLADMFYQGIMHRGFALIDVMQPCVTFNKLNTYEYFTKRCYKLDEKYDPTDKMGALAKAQEWGAGIPIGVFYREEKPTYEDGTPQLAAGPLVKQALARNISALLSEFE